MTRDRAELEAWLRWHWLALVSLIAACQKGKNPNGEDMGSANSEPREFDS